MERRNNENNNNNNNNNKIATCTKDGHGSTLLRLKADITKGNK